MRCLVGFFVDMGGGAQKRGLSFCLFWSLLRCYATMKSWALNSSFWNC